MHFLKSALFLLAQVGKVHFLKSAILRSLIPATPAQCEESVKFETGRDLDQSARIFAWRVHGPDLGWQVPEPQACIGGQNILRKGIKWSGAAIPRSLLTYGRFWLSHRGFLAAT